MDAQQTIKLKRIVEFFRVFGVVIFAVILAAFDFWLLYRADIFRSAFHFEQHVFHAIIVVGGLVTVLAPYEVASWTGRYGWTRATYRVLPEEIMRMIGFAALVGVTWQLVNTTT